MARAPRPFGQAHPARPDFGGRRCQSAALPHAACGSALARRFCEGEGCVRRGSGVGLSLGCWIGKCKIWGRACADSGSTRARIRPSGGSNRGQLRGEFPTPRLTGPRGYIGNGGCRGDRDGCWQRSGFFSQLPLPIGAVVVSALASTQQRAFEETLALLLSVSFERSYQAWHSRQAPRGGRYVSKSKQHRPQHRPF